MNTAAERLLALTKSRQLHCNGIETFFFAFFLTPHIRHIIKYKCPPVVSPVCPAGRLVGLLLQVFCFCLENEMSISVFICFKHRHRVVDAVTGASATDITSFIITLRGRGVEKIPLFEIGFLKIRFPRTLQSCNRGYL